jgi:hypothetical protein
LRKMKKEGERWAEWVEREEKEKRERQGEEERTRGQACGLVERQVEETYIDNYEYSDDY